MNSELAWTNTRVLVTGGAGFIGSHLVQRLARDGATVTVLDNLQAGKWENLGGIDRRQETADRRPQTEERSQEPRTESRPAVAGSTLRSEIPNPESTQPVILRCIHGDVRDAGTVAAVMRDSDPEYVFHMAANASVPGSVADPRYDFESNAAGAFNVLDACRGLKGLRKTVLASSGAVYGEPREFPLTESSPLAPISPYGASKLAAETEARVFSSVYGTPVVIARIFNSYGPRMPRFVVFDFLRKLQKDPSRLEILGNGKQVRDLNYVTDTVAGLILLAEKGATGESYNLASGRHHNVTEIARELLDVLGLSGRTKLAFSGESWDGDAQRWEVAVDKIASLGYSPAVGLREGLERVTRWFEGKFGAVVAGK